MELHELMVRMPLLLTVPAFVTWLLLRAPLQHVATLKRTNLVLNMMWTSYLFVWVAFKGVVAITLRVADLPIGRSGEMVLYVAISALLLVQARPLALRQIPEDDTVTVRAGVVGIRLLAAVVAAAVVALMLQ